MKVGKLYGKAAEKVSGYAGAAYRERGNIRVHRRGSDSALPGGSAGTDPIFPT